MRAFSDLLLLVPGAGRHLLPLGAAGAETGRDRGPWGLAGAEETPPAAHGGCCGHVGWVEGTAVTLPAINPSRFCALLCFHQNAARFAPLLSVVVGFLFSSNFVFVARAASGAGLSEEV